MIVFVRGYGVFDGIFYIGLTQFDKSCYTGSKMKKRLPIRQVNFRLLSQKQKPRQASGEGLGKTFSSKLMTSQLASMGRFGQPLIAGYK